MNNDEFFYPQKMGRIILLGMEEVISKGGVDAILHLAELDDLIQNYPPSKAEKSFSFEKVSLLLGTLEQAYGPRGGRGLALRTGRASFKYGLKEYGSMLGLTEVAFRLLPLTTKLRVGARSFAELFNKHTDQRVRVEETDNTIFWHIERCPLCWERKADEPICHLAVGLLQEALYWLSGGKVFNVEETACIARGDSNCTILVYKTPLS
ncbi:MAG: 4-vinyl reductase [Anaerolineales bacterium]|nr:MAG: 4-vinyl reductase [Anaerolineales bacterium]